MLPAKRSRSYERPPVLYGVTLRNFIVNGLSAIAFILLMKGLVAPRLPAGGQKLLAAV